MSKVNVINVLVCKPQARFHEQISFEIFFEALEPLQHGKYFILYYKITALTWRIVYIGQASNPAYDVVLQEAEMGCEQAGQMRFVLDAEAPNPQQLPE
jgi:hypothetical protein